MNSVYLKLLIAVAVLVSGFASIEAAPPEPVAFILCSDAAQVDRAPAGNRVAEKGWVPWATDTGPRLKAATITRVLLHNPGGIFFLGWIPDRTNPYGPPHIKSWDMGVDAREMWCQQWLLAEQSHLPYANRYDLRTAHGILLANGVTEVIYYLGSPLTLQNAVKEGPACVEMFTALGPASTVSFCFDATAYPHEVQHQDTARTWKMGDDVTKFFDSLREAGHRVYVEPRFTPELVHLGKHVDGTVAQPGFDAAHVGTSLMAPNQPGETIRIGDNNKLPSSSWPSGVTPALRFDHGFSTTFKPETIAPWLKAWRTK